MPRQAAWRGRRRETARAGEEAPHRAVVLLAEEVPVDPQIRHAVGQRPGVGTVEAQRVEHVAEREHLRQRIDVLAGAACRVTGAVGAFMVIAYHRRQPRRRRGEARGDGSPYGHVALDLAPFAGADAGVAAGERRIDMQQPEVVQQARLEQQPGLGGIEAPLPGQQHAKAGAEQRAVEHGRQDFLEHTEFLQQGGAQRGRLAQRLQARGEAGGHGDALQVGRAVQQFAQARGQCAVIEAAAHRERFVDGAVQAMAVHPAEGEAPERRAAREQQHAELVAHVVAGDDHAPSHADVREVLGVAVAVADREFAADPLGEGVVQTACPRQRW